jgi:hypothetical protein
MKTNIIAFLLLVGVCGISLAPAVAFGADAQYPGLVKCDGVVDKNNPAQKKCDFIALINQVQTIINWMFYISIPIAIALFAYAGILYMTGTSGNVSQAKSIFTTVGIGFALMASAWFVVYTILSWITKDGQGFTTLLK